MAYWNRKGKAVYVYHWKEGKQCPLPRDVTRHLDGEPDHNIEYWIANYERTHEGPKRNIVETLANKELQDLVEQYAKFQEGRGRVRETVGQHRIHLLRDVIPFFLSYGLTDPNQWVSKSFELHDHLREKGYDWNPIHRSNVALRGFWKWLQLKRHIVTPYQLNLLNPVRRANPTPLKFTVSPEDILRYCRACKDPDLKMMALVGYFCSLRPQETFALRRSDFSAGKAVLQLEACRVMRTHELYDRLAVRVERQRRKDGSFSEPKSSSKGIVACFSNEAARMIVESINTLPADDLVIGGGLPDWQFVRWRRRGIKGITLKDLRRASLYYLGHTAGLSFTALKNHARHSRAETTTLYLRRPEEAFKDEVQDLLDLDA